MENCGSFKSFDFIYIYKLLTSQMPCACTVLCITTFENPTKPRESLHMKFVQIMQYKVYYKMQDIFLICVGTILDICFITWWVLIICSILHFQDGTLKPS